MRLLLVDEERERAGPLAATLALDGNDVVHIAETATAWQQITRRPADLLLLACDDLHRSLLLVRRLRRAPAGQLPDPSIPVVVLARRVDMRMRVAVLDAGADAVLSHGAPLEEVAAFVRAVQRRHNRGRVRLKTVGDLQVDPSQCVVLRAGEPIELTVTQHQVLLALAEASPNFLLPQEIAAHTRPQVTSTAMHVHVHQLRRRLGDARIETFRGRGYRLVPGEGEE